MAPLEGNGGTVFDFYDDWEDDGHDDLFSSEIVDNSKQHKGNSFKAAKSKNSSSASGGMDEEDRRFFEELSKGFSAKDEQHEDDIPERNELMDDTRATRQMLAV